MTDGAVAWARWIDPEIRPCSTSFLVSTSPTSHGRREERGARARAAAGRAPGAQWDRGASSTGGPTASPTSVVRVHEPGGGRRRGRAALGARRRPRSRHRVPGRPSCRTSSPAPAASPLPSSGVVRPRTRTRGRPRLRTPRSAGWRGTRPWIRGTWSWRCELGRGAAAGLRCWLATRARSRWPARSWCTRCSTTGRSPPRAARSATRLWNHESNRLGWAAYLGARRRGGPAYAARPARATDLGGPAGDLVATAGAGSLPRRGHRTPGVCLAARECPPDCTSIPVACTASTCSRPDAALTRRSAATGTRRSTASSRAARCTATGGNRVRNLQRCP